MELASEHRLPALYQSRCGGALVGFPVPPDGVRVQNVCRFRSACPDRMNLDLNSMIEGCQDFYHAVHGKALEVGISDAGAVRRINPRDRGGLWPFLITCRKSGEAYGQTWTGQRAEVQR